MRDVESYAKQGEIKVWDTGYNLSVGELMAIRNILLDEYSIDGGMSGIMTAFYMGVECGSRQAKRKKKRGCKRSEKDRFLKN